MSSSTSSSPADGGPADGARPAPGSPSGQDGRERILDTAEWLMAERGTESVSLREINQTAGQRNASGVQYHFENRAGLIQAVVSRHMSPIDVRRNRMLDDLPPAKAGKNEIDPHEAMRILVTPLADELLTASGRCYLRIIQHLIDQPDSATTVATVATNNTSLRRVIRLLRPGTASLPKKLQAERAAQVTSFLLRALADRARLVDRDGTNAGQLSNEVFVANLIDVLVGVLTTPMSGATIDAAARRA